MQITDPVADMLTRIRNANSAKHDTVDVPASNLKKAIAQILLDEGYIKAFPWPGHKWLQPRPPCWGHGGWSSPLRYKGHCLWPQSG